MDPASGWSQTCWGSDRFFPKARVFFLSVSSVRAGPLGDRMPEALSLRKRGEAPQMVVSLPWGHPWLCSHPSTSPRMCQHHRFLEQIQLKPPLGSSRRGPELYRRSSHSNQVASCKGVMRETGECRLKRGWTRESVITFPPKSLSRKSSPQET